MRTKICLLLLVVALLISGCTITKEVSRETTMVDAIVTGVDYDPPRTTYVLVGKVMVPQCHPADYDIFVEYNGTTATIDSKDLYLYYENRIGETIQMELITITYENGEVRYKLERSG